MDADRERSGSVTISWNGRLIKAPRGDDVATALYAAGIRVFGYSRKFHRPIGLSGSFVAGVKAQVDGLANVRLDRLPAREGLAVEAQNVWPHPHFDLLQLARLVPRPWLAAGFEHPSWLPSGTRRFQAWERLLRLAAGGGRAVSADRSGAAVAGQRLTVDLAVVGGGPAGRSAAVAAATAGQSVVLISRSAVPGAVAHAMGATLPELPRAVQVLAGFEAAAIYRGGRLLVAAPQDGGPAKLIESTKIVLATGRRSIPPLVPGADLPGVLDLPTAVRLLQRCPLGSVCLIGTGDLALTSARLTSLGANIVVTAAAEDAVCAIQGSRQVHAVLLGNGREIVCDAVVHAGPWRPDPALPFQASAAGDFRLSAGALPPSVELAGSAAGSDEPVAFGPRLDDRAMVCPCMDVSVGEIRRLVEAGTTHVEELKRLTGCGMGPCQGFPCWDLLAAALSVLTGRNTETFGHPSYRAPRGTLTVGQAAGLAELVEPEKTATTIAADQRPPTKVAGTKAAVAIIGGGIQGLMLAFCLAERGVRDIRVFDAGYWQGGASGRNGTLVRPAFSSPEWTGLFSHSLRLWRGLSRRLGHNVMYSQRGYITLGESDRTAAICEQVVQVSRDCGVPTHAMGPEELAGRLPTLDRNRVKAAVMFDEGGVVPHHAAMKGLRAACEGRGVDLHYQSRITGIDRQGDRAIGLWLGDVRIAADCIVIAAGAHSPSVAALAGVELEGYPWRIEACALEPTRPTFDPAVAMLDRTVYMHQTARGEIVGGCEVAGDSSGLTVTSDLPVIAHYARHLVETMPCLADLRILRQWAGHIHASEDFGPLLGPHPDCRDLWISAGWSYGIAGAPAGGELLGKAIATGEIDSRMAVFAVDRKRRGKLISEGAIVVSH